MLKTFHDMRMICEVASNEGENKRGDAGQPANPSRAPLLIMGNKKTPSLLQEEARH